tara:strand:- start:6535 stop:6735 length:201 start_codon:yes stop_codon:yes gene_type:complete
MMIEVGDLVRVKPNSFVQIDDMAVVSNALPASGHFFYGILCSTGKEELLCYEECFSVDGFACASPV